MVTDRKKKICHLIFWLIIDIFIYFLKKGDRSKKQICHQLKWLIYVLFNKKVTDLFYFFLNFLKIIDNLYRMSCIFRKFKEKYLSSVTFLLFFSIFSQKIGDKSKKWICHYLSPSSTKIIIFSYI